MPPPVLNFSQLQAGKYTPSFELAFRLARAFGVGVQDVFHWVE
jgi:putative transcriptional regulator